jgi:hypothetical protein
VLDLGALQRQAHWGVAADASSAATPVEPS